MKESFYRGWEYAAKGDYHRNIDPNWSYAPTYYQKEIYLRNFINSLPADAIIRDLGCGEGVFVEEFAKAGRNVRGLDLNYESECVEHGSVLKLPYADQSVNAIVFMDVFEHLSFADQPIALKEIYRVLAPKGKLFISIPNLAHLNSRWWMLWKGELDRTDIETNHIGERPYRENAWMILRNGFSIKRKIGITLTMPWIYRSIICKNPKKYLWLHNLFNGIAEKLPQISLLNIFVCEK